MKLVEQHIIKKSNPYFNNLQKVCRLSKNLYNQALYVVRQEYIKNKIYLDNYKLSHKLSSENNSDYRALPAKVSQSTLKLLHQNFKSFFSLLKNKSVKNKLPKYLDKEGYYVVIYSNQAISKKFLKQGYLKLSGLEFLIKTDKKNINEVRVIPKGNHFVVEIVYEKVEEKLKDGNNRYCSIDLGVNNLATIASNVIKPIIISGRPLKSINQYYNKKVAAIKTKLAKSNKTTSNLLKSIHLKRNNKVKDYLHKSSRTIIKHLVSNNINTLIIGYNKGWKQAINLGSKVNQNFVQIPFLKFIEMIKYKCKLAGISVTLHEESYTSKCSFLDNEEIRKHRNYKGQRIKRGLFKTEKGKLINADHNSALNILKKAIGEFQYPIEVCSTPIVLTIKY